MSFGNKPLTENKNVENVLCEVARGHWNNLLMDSVWFGVVSSIAPQSNRIMSWVPPLGQLSNLEWDARVSCLRCTDTTAKSVERYISPQRCNHRKVFYISWEIFLTDPRHIWMIFRMGYVISNSYYWSVTETCLEFPKGEEFEDVLLVSGRKQMGIVIMH